MLSLGELRDAAVIEAQEAQLRALGASIAAGEIKTGVLNGSNSKKIEVMAMASVEAVEVLVVV